ncbi:WbqC family protein, partial [Phocaeicola barnesiae]|uniref:WbqC family protein n=1 Tax=Phocaeicola barnesiae TaxID=376804 RepID=UPI00241CBD38
MQKEVLLSSAYLAPVVYYTRLYACEKAYIERYDHYMKQTYRNRCVIASANGPLALTIPTEKADEAKCLMKDVRISDHGNWRHTHWNA